MKDEKKLKFNPGPWGVAALTTIYILVMNLYFDYCVSRELDQLLQMAAALSVAYYTWWQLRLIVLTISNYLTNQIKNKKEEK